MGLQKRDRKGMIGAAFIFAPVGFLLIISAIYFGIVFTVPRQANHIAYLAGPLVGFVVSCLIWIFLLLVFLGVPFGIILLFLSIRQKTK